MKPISDLTDDELVALARCAARLPDAPPEWQRAAESLWYAREPAASPTAVAAAIGAVVRRVVAALAFDSGAGPALAHGMRSVGGPVRQLLFSALERDIDLRVAPHDGGGFVLQGQVLGPDAGGRARLAPASAGAAPEAAREAAHEAEVDAFGEFRLAGVAAGDWVLTLHLGGDEITLPPLTLDAPA